MWIRLKNLCKTIFSGKSPKYSKEKTNNIAIGQAANTGVKIDLSLAKYCTDEFVKDMPNYYYLQKNDILLNTLGHGTLGRSGMYELNNDDILTDGHLFVFRLFNEITSTILHKYFILNRTNIEKSSNGTTNQIFLSLSTVGDYLFPLPPLEEQQRIVDKINSFEPLLEKYDKVEKELSKLEKEFPEKLKKSILQYAIEGKLVKQDPNDEPASVLLERIKQEKERLIKEGKIKRDKNKSYIYQGDDKNYYKNMPIGWVKCCLSNVAKIIMGQSPNGNTYGDIGTEFHQGKIFFTDRIIGVSNIKTSTPIKITSKYSLVMSVRAPVGDVNYCNREICIGRGLCSIEYFIPELTNYLYIILKANSKFFNDKSTGTTFKAINMNVISSLPILLPPLNEQKNIVNKINKINMYL